MFPAGISKTYWRSLDGQNRSNVLMAVRAHQGQDVGLAMFRGIPERPAWLKGHVDRLQMGLLQKSVLRKLRREVAEAKHRETARRTCQHQWDRRHPTMRCCVLCGRVE